MLEKWKQWVMKLNLKKSVRIFAITCLVLAAAFFVAVYSNFQDRISQWEQDTETDRDYGRKEKRKLGKMFQKRYLSAGDLAFVAGCCIIGMVTGVEIF